MRASRFFLPAIGVSGRRIGLAACVSFLALLAICAFAAPVWASAPPKYTLEITEGETTLPEYPILSTSGRVEHTGSGSVAVSITHGGIVVAKSAGEEGGAWMSQVPQVGDVVSLESPVGTTVGAVVYDGLPSIDPTVCAGSPNFSGQNSPGETVRGGYFTEMQNPYREEERAGRGRAQVTILSGTSFGGSFLSPLAFGQTVYAEESLETPLAGDAVFDYSSLNERPVGACPAPPPPPLPPPPPPALQGLLKFTRTTIHRLLTHGWLDQVTINQPGTVIQDLYLQGGTLPTFASFAGVHGHRHKRKPPALLLAHGSATAKTAGTVNVLIRVTTKGRRALRHARRVHAVLITTLRSTSGAKLSLGRRSVLLKR
jgi:hypothetical protein